MCFGMEMKHKITVKKKKEDIYLLGAGLGGGLGTGVRKPSSLTLFQLAVKVL